MNHTKPRKNGRFCYLTSLALLGGAALAAACSSPPFKAAEPEGSGGAGENTGGAEADGGVGETGGRATGGGGGASGSGGSTAEEDAGLGEASAGGAPGEEDSGTGVTPECVRDSDCIALTCNGEPRCNDDGKCDPGLPCENPDAAHCSVSCVRSGGQASCEATGLDADADGHFDAACVSGGGDDCDDKNPTTYTGAAEQCDGVDNDCDGLADVEDGLPLAGTPTLVHEITGTASLGMAAAPEGYGVLELVRPGTFPDVARGASVLSIDFDGKTAITALNGSFRDEPSIGFNSSKFVVYEDGDAANSGSPHLLRLPFAGSSPSTEDVPRLNTTGRAFGAPTNAPFYPSSGAMFTTHPDSAGRSFLCFGGLTPEPAWDCSSGILGVDAPAGLFNPAYSSGAFAWVQTSAPLGKEHDLTVLFTTIDEAAHAMRPPERLQLQSFKADGMSTTAYRYQALRPQVVTTAADYLVGWLNDGGLNVARFDTLGKKVCSSASPVQVHSWGWTNSLISFIRFNEPRMDVYAAVVTNERVPALIRIDGNCAVGAPIPLAPKGVKVALGQNLLQGKPLLEVGHPVIANYQNGHVGVAWVEEPKANGLHRVMFRTFGDRLCN